MARANPLILLKLSSRYKVAPDTARRECSNLSGYCLHFVPECGLALEQLVASGPKLRTFI